ncbi:hypothetical protein PIROE2DRAFT_4114 [Piromyces sp. E2]|nr:hypothetical protein PIROE2DRAFT_4114 [Piromyces sp. E2]|eukprot:OUM68236.1 hypothetical protein PIROE2DRAFT_4114 [Piromyces sp. E2]
MRYQEIYKSLLWQEFVLHNKSNALSNRENLIVFLETLFVLFLQCHIILGPKNLKFQNSTSITRLGFQKPHINHGIIWIIRICCGFENTTLIAIANNRITPDCPNYCPCCDHGEQTFLHWILLCPALTQYRTSSLVHRGSHVPYMENLSAFLSKTIPIIRHRNLTLVPYTRSDVKNSLNDNIND